MNISFRLGNGEDDDEFINLEFIQNLLNQNFDDSPKNLVLWLAVALFCPRFRNRHSNNNCDEKKDSVKTEESESQNSTNDTKIAVKQ